MGFVLESRQAQNIIIDGRSLVIFSSNDYLGLSHHPEVIAAAHQAAIDFGCGTGGAPGTSGTTKLHTQLASAIAAFKHREKAIIFPSGYAANVAIHQALAAENTIFYYDQKHHPSAVDGVRLSGCQKRIFDHRDLGRLEAMLKGDTHSRKIVTLPSVFTVTGEIAPLPALYALKKKYGFALIIDEAHATGCIGQTGGGLEEMYSLIGSADFIMGTFSKALGSQGGFLVFSDNAEQMLARTFRPFIYSTSLSAMSVAASLKAIEILRTSPDLVNRMRQNIKIIYGKLSQARLDMNQPESHIANVYLSSREHTAHVKNALHDSGYFVVELHLDNRSGLRITAMATHTADQIEGFCNSLIAAAK
jgi:7-keto-8-aminopelargonate synthetase-like enzyme